MVAQGEISLFLPGYTGKPALRQRPGAGTGLKSHFWHSWKKQIFNLPDAGICPTLVCGYPAPISVCSRQPEIFPRLSHLDIVTRDFRTSREAVTVMRVIIRALFTCRLHSKRSPGLQSMDLVALYLAWRSIPLCIQSNSSLPKWRIECLSVLCIRNSCGFLLLSHCSIY